jgi:hypothetical protein
MWRPWSKNFVMSSLDDFVPACVPVPVPGKDKPTTTLGAVLEIAWLAPLG